MEFAYYHLLDKFNLDIRSEYGIDNLNNLIVSVGRYFADLNMGN